MDGPTLRALCVQPHSIQSLREFNWEVFKERIAETESLVPLKRMEQLSSHIAGGPLHIAGGHQTMTLRVRVGQRAFRFALAKKYGNVCAFSGPQPSSVLEAAHLYSYATNGEHDESGGLLLRRDLHRLFDLGLICVNPTTTTLDVHSDLSQFPQYTSLSGAALHVSDVGQRMRSWLEKHWDQHRTASRTGPTR